MDPTLYEPMDIGYVPSLEIETALANLDSRRVWQAAQAGTSPEDYYDAVRAHTFNRTVTSFRGSAVAAVHNSSLLLIPIVVYPEQLAHDAPPEVAISSQTMERISALLSRWAKDKSTVAMLTQTLSYDAVAWNDPVALRNLLNQLGHKANDRSGHADVTMEENAYGIALPEGAPSLQFLTGALVCTNRLPVMPMASTNGSHQLAAQLQVELRFAIEDMQTRDGALTVHLPTAADTAIESGLIAWIEALHAKYHFGKWDALPTGTDRVDVVIELMDATQDTIVIPLRTYQLGVNGLQRTLQRIAALASGLFDRAEQKAN